MIAFQIIRPLWGESAGNMWISLTNEQLMGRHCNIFEWLLLGRNTMLESAKKQSSLFMINPCYRHNTHLSRLFTGTKSCVTHYWMPDISTDHLFGYERTAFAVVLWLRLIHSFVENKTYTVETLCSTIYYSKYFIELNIDRSTLYVALWTHKRHPIPRPFGRAMECLLWVLQ